MKKVNKQKCILNDLFFYNYKKIRVKDAKGHRKIYWHNIKVKSIDALTYMK